MTTYVLRRLIATIWVLLGVTLGAFLIIQLTPGDPARVILGQDASPEAIADLRSDLGLDQPLPVQYLSFLGNVIRGDLGTSYRSSRPVLNELGSSFPNTVELAVAAVIIATVIGMSLGVLSALKRGTLIDTTATTLTLIGVSIPNFWLGIMLMLAFSYHLGWFPASGRGGPLYSWDGIRSVLLPAFTLATGSAAVIARITRTSLLEVFDLDYIRTARAKGVREGLITRRHALANALIPIVTVVGLQFGFLLGGAVVTERIFAWPGLGLVLVNAISNRDLPLVQGALLLVAGVFVLLNLLTDLLYGFLDPRIRYD